MDSPEAASASPPSKPATDAYPDEAFVDAKMVSNVVPPRPVPGVVVPRVLLLVVVSEERPAYESIDVS